ncbi:Uncharacterized conserved protein, DUF2336 family [Tistlia consotensis]|uniref:Uncharacterized conserved protein, DUF2336 family n=2 Tax=Tistlia TaxID=1321364 RepID=A0A1Y6BKE4_9PROT|nr:Uncharacterized conserved protein, DUF2336 family [Tistlia consotensis USBA 355]SNR51062.1 Uncharacterized conserved protein, DUF2336 family [Tistlia consotensis]
MAAQHLSARDVERLLADRSPDVRIDTLEKVFEELESGGLSPREAEIAQGILERFALDVEERVREALARQIAQSPLLTRELAETLANDLAEIALPVLRHAEVLDDRFLVRVIEQKDAAKQIAISQRRRISEVVAEALVDSANVKAIVTLLRNEGAEIAEATLNKALTRYGDLPPVSEAIAERPLLPMPVVERLLHLVSEELREGLAERHRISPVVLRQLVGRAREAATLPLLKPVAGRAHDLSLFVGHLLTSNRLTASLMFRGLCAGELAFFLEAVAARCRIGSEAARQLVLEGGALGLRRIFEQARLPIALLPPFQSALAVIRACRFDDEELDPGEAEDARRELQIAVLARVFEDCSDTEEPQVDELLMQLFDQTPAAAMDEAMDRAGMPFAPV